MASFRLEQIYPGEQGADLDLASDLELQQQLDTATSPHSESGVGQYVRPGSKFREAEIPPQHERLAGSDLWNTNQGRDESVDDVSLYYLERSFGIDDNAVHHYVPSDTIQKAMQEGYHKAIARDCPVFVEFLDQRVVFYPGTNEAHTTFSPNDLNVICKNNINYKDCKIRYLKGGDQRTEKQKRPEGGILQADMLVWRFALMCSNGRLPEGVSPQAWVSLKRWPNLTRVYPLPGALQVAALWDSQTTRIMETADLLHIARNDVFSFFSAAQALGLVELNSRYKTPKTKRSDKPKNGQRKLFKRILQHLGFGKLAA